MSEIIVPTVDPQDTDAQEADELLNEIMALLARKRCILRATYDEMRHKPLITIGVENAAESAWRAIAQAEYIAPDRAIWRVIKWRKFQKPNF